MEENTFIKNIFNALKRLGKKGKGQYQDNIIDVCGKGFHMGEKIVTDNLELAVLTVTSMIQRAAANNRVSCQIEIQTLLGRKNQCLNKKLPQFREMSLAKVFFLKMILSN